MKQHFITLLIVLVALAIWGYVGPMIFGSKES